MPREINARHEQGRLLPQYLDDKIPDDHPVRFIIDFVNSLNLEGLGVKISKSKYGRSYYAPELLLGCWLYGYINNFRSTRGLEWYIKNDLGGIFLTDWQGPDNNTLWRFFAKNKKLIANLFKEVTQVASELNLVDLVLQALDGTKIRSEASTRSYCDSERLELLLANLDSRILEIMKEIKSQRNKEEKELRLTKELKNKEERKAKIEKAMEELRKSGRKQVSPEDTDARLMKNGKVTRSSFNAQAGVDEKSGIIITETVVNDENDNKMLTTMVEKAEENLGEKPKETIVDTGYYSPNELLKAKDKGIDVLVNIPKQMVPERNPRKYHKSKFKYDQEKDVFICPEGKELKYRGIKKDRHNKDMDIKIYHCKEYKKCPKRTECSTAKRGRTVEMGPHYQAVLDQLEKQEEQVAREILAKRKSIVERVFAQIKWNMGFTRFTYGGLDKVRAQWSLVCTAYNLKKIYKIWKKEKLIFNQI
jgi:transposase